MNKRQDRFGNPLSLLGYGCMRFTLKGGKPDVDKAEREIRHALELGINYYDMAYTYPHIEETFGEILRRNPGMREKLNIATKLPHYMVKKAEDFERIFREELTRIGTDHIDYYLMHMLTDYPAWERMCALGIEDWIKEKRESGQIRQIGFSYHGNADMFIKILDAYDWDFTQIQYNYLDEHSQAGVTGLRAAAKKGIPVIIMEPLRGGKLANLPADAEALLRAVHPKRSPAEWSFRWLYDQPEVTCVLSGMNSIEMIDENARVASEAGVGNLTEEDRAAIRQVISVLNRKMKVGCTGCRYCMPCPHGVDIPGTFSAYNLCYSENWYHAEKQYIMCQVLRKNPTVLTNCIGCGLCEKRCPQGIAIRKELKNAGKVLEGLPTAVVKKVVPLFMKY